MIIIISRGYHIFHISYLTQLSSAWALIRPKLIKVKLFCISLIYTQQSGFFMATIRCVFALGHTECYKLVDQWQKATRTVCSWLNVIRSNSSLSAIFYRLPCVPWARKQAELLVHSVKSTSKDYVVFSVFHLNRCWRWLYIIIMWRAKEVLDFVCHLSILHLVSINSTGIETRSLIAHHPGACPGVNNRG